MADYDIEIADHWMKLRRQSVQDGSVWRHKKRGTEYKVLTLAIRETDGHPLVIYQCLKDGRTWAREAGLFTDGRFVKISD